MSIKTPLSAMEVAILAQAIPLQKAADLIEQYAKTVAAGARAAAVAETYDRVLAGIAAPLARKESAQ